MWLLIVLMLLWVMVLLLMCSGMLCVIEIGRIMFGCKLVSVDIVRCMLIMIVEMVSGMLLKGLLVVLVGCVGGCGWVCLFLLNSVVSVVVGSVRVSC